VLPYVDPNEQLVTELYVRDVNRSFKFYADLGFIPIRILDDFAEFTWEGNRFMLEEHKDWDWPSIPMHPQGNIRVMVPDVDNFWILAKNMKVPVLKPINDREYGLRDFTIRDPDGFAIRFASRINDSN